MRAAAALLLCSLVLCEAYQLGGIGTMPETQAPGWMPVMPTLGSRHTLYVQSRGQNVRGLYKRRTRPLHLFTGIFFLPRPIILKSF